MNLAGGEKPSIADKESGKEGIEINKSLIALRTGMARLKQATLMNTADNNNDNNSPNSLSSSSLQSFFRGSKMTELLEYMLGDDTTMVWVLVLLTINPGAPERLCTKVSRRSTLAWWLRA